MNFQKENLESKCKKSSNARSVKKNVKLRFKNWLCINKDERDK